MKKYLVFAGDRYYPSPAFGDFKRAFETHTAAWNYKEELEKKDL